MRRVVTALFVLTATFFVATALFAQDQSVESKITQVTVFPRDALITREAALKLGVGKHKAIFANIIPDVDENSLRVSTAADNGVKILGAEIKKEFLQDTPVEKVKQLQQQIQDLSDQMRKIEDTKKVLGDEKQFLDSVRLFSNGQIPKELVTKMPPAQELENTLKFLDAKLRDNYLQVVEAEIKNRENQKKMQALQEELGQISGRQRKLKRSIVVELELKDRASFDLSVSYLVRGASWQPIYDARADFDKEQVELVSYGIVTQRTGEDWQDVTMCLSTAKPAVGGRMPYVAPWLLRLYQPMPPEEKQDFRRAEMSKMKAQYMAFDKNISLEAETLIQGKDLQEFAVAEEKGIAVSYQLPRKVEVKSDGSEHKLPVSTQSLAAKFEYSAFPRAVIAAYLGSRVTNAPNLQLLAGRVNIFLSSDFVGTSSIDNIGPGEEFDLYLGVDENVKVKRELVEKKVDETIIGNIPGLNKKITYNYKLTIENYKSRKIKVKLFEAMPVPQDDRIKVKINFTSLEPKEKDWKDRKGIWLWEFELEPKQKQEVSYSFVVEHPRSIQVEGL